MTPGPATGALAGIRVIDVSRILGGPYCTQVLADHGADVIKVEPPNGDETRRWGPPFVHGTAAYYVGANRGKRDIAIDLSIHAGRGILRKLLQNADVLVENFKIGTLEKWGIGYATLHAEFPRLIHCRISGFGADGPLGGLPGYDAVAQAMSGIMSVNGEAGGEPLRVGIPAIDMVAGLNAVIGITLALLARRRTGQGQFVEATLFDTGLALMHPHFPNVFYGGPVPRPTGNQHPSIAPYEAFQTRTELLFVACGSDMQFRKLCGFLERPTLPGDDRFKTNATRLRNRAVLHEALQEALVDKDAGEIATRLMALGVPAGPILDATQAVAHPHTAHRDMLVRMDWYRGTGSPVKLSETPATYRCPPPSLGQDGRAIMGELGLDAATQEALIRAGVVGAGE